MAKEKMESAEEFDMSEVNFAVGRRTPPLLVLLLSPMILLLLPPLPRTSQQ